MKDNILCIFIMLFVSVTFNANAQKSPARIFRQDFSYFLRFYP